MAKVQEIYALDAALPNCSEKLRILLLEISGNIRNATIWPPNCHSPLWQKDAVVKIMGVTANMQYHNFSAGSDSVVQIDTEIDRNESNNNNVN